MVFETSRISVSGKGNIFRTHSMIDYIKDEIITKKLFDNVSNKKQTELVENLSCGVLGAWVGVLRYKALSMAENDKEFFLKIQSGNGVLDLNEDLAPSGWRTEDVINQVSIQTGLNSNSVRVFLNLIKDKFGELSGNKAFEPIGWIEKKDNGSFQASLWKDFLLPVNDDDPPELI